MPFISDAASAIKSRFGFHDRASGFGDALPAARSTPNLSKSASAEDLSQASAVRSIRGCFDDGECSSEAATLPAQSFELCEDSTFWKDHNVQVIIRIRPLNSSELSLQGYGKCVRQESCQTVTWLGPPESRFTFDHVADENVTQEKLFKVAGVPMVDNCMGGYNSCMFAYGQTGSGKTHTMLGDIEGGTRRHSVNCGMTPRVFEYLFSRVQKEKELRRDEMIKFTCRCSFLEIYNEQILDLLEPSSNNLQLREDVKKGVYVEGLKEIEVSSARDVMQQLIQGAANRKVATTNMNLASSRSHSVFTCVIESKWESQGVTHHRFSRLNLVDLAGSERQKSSGAEGERLKEATNINKSLSTLGLVIMNLINVSNGKSLHVPYRDSKLTFLLQDSLGGNSKTIIISNISPSTSCSLETLSTLKFAQRAKFIKNNAMVNEDASGDVIAMRIQIQQLKREVSRLQGLASGPPESYDNDTLAVTFPGSPISFQWEGANNGLISPLPTGKTMPQKKGYEVDLVGAFRREKDKEIALQALAAENQLAMQLAKQREDEIQGLRMRLRFREAAIKRLEAVVSGKISAETHLLKEKEEYLKEIDVLRTQVKRNQEVTRFAMENLRLKEEIRRLKLFYEEGEREMMSEQLTVLQNKLLEALDWKLMHEAESKKVNSHVVIEEIGGDDMLISNKKSQFPWQISNSEETEFLRVQAIQYQAELDTLRNKLNNCLEEKNDLERFANDLVTKLEDERTLLDKKARTQQVELPPLSAEAPFMNLSDQMELKTMVDTIAAASQREAEAHKTAIVLSRENDELRMKLKVLIDDNNKLIELYESASAECNNRAVEESKNRFVVGFGEDKESEVNKVENLEHQLAEMHEENEKLLGLYERAMQERDEFKRMLSLSGEKKACDSKTGFDCVEKVNGDEALASEAHIVTQGCMEVEDTTMQLEDTIDSRQQDLGNVVDMETSSIEIVDIDDCGLQDSGNLIDVGTSPMKIQPPYCISAKVSEDLSSARMKLEMADKQIVDSVKAIAVFNSLERLAVEMGKLLRETQVTEGDLQKKQKLHDCLKLRSSEIQERRVVAAKKISALKYSLSSFSSSVAYFEQRESRAALRVNALTVYLGEKQKELVALEVKKKEIKASLANIQQSESESADKLSRLVLKLEEENRKQENEKVLFAIDNIEKTDPSQKNWNLGGSKATDLLKSEEEKTQLQLEVKQSRERLGLVRRENEGLKRKSEKLDEATKAIKTEVEKALKSFEDLELAFRSVQQEKSTLLEMTDNGFSEIESAITEYYEHTFEAEFKEAEMRELEGDLRAGIRGLEEMQRAKVVATGTALQILDSSPDRSGFVSEKMEKELQCVRASVVEAKLLLLVGE